MTQLKVSSDRTSNKPDSMLMWSAKHSLACVYEHPLVCAVSTVILVQHNVSGQWGVWQKGPPTQNTRSIHIPQVFQERLPGQGSVIA